jgi:IMP dehydrogenase
MRTDHTCDAAGLPASRLFGQGVSFTYDDIIVLPGHIDFGAHEVGVSDLT